VSRILDIFFGAGGRFSLIIEINGFSTGRSVTARFGAAGGTAGPGGEAVRIRMPSLSFAKRTKVQNGPKQHI